MKFKINRKKSLKDQDSRFKILYSHKPMHYNGTEIDTNIQYQYLHSSIENDIISLIIEYNTTIDKS